ncbi:MAG: Druantia anti-phage system protein DruA, partial [Spartobacteria bacterium]
MKIQEVAESFLFRVSLRLIHEEERVRFDQLLETLHYLESARIGGRYLRYVAEVDGDWVAILAFSGAAPHLKPREKWLGWSPRQRARRLGFVINNSRFLLLVERERHPNLASKILALSLRRVAQDWQERWEQRPLVVESFVDESRFRGTCYRACGFEQVGASAGFSRDARDYYTEHGQPKALYLRELEPGARKLLSRPQLPAALQDHEANIAGPCPFKAAELGSLYERFRVLQDERRGHGLHHRATSTLACAAVATLMGAGSYQSFEDVCKRLTNRQLCALRCHSDHKTKRYIAPSDSTFYRIMSKVDAAHVEAIIARWLLEQDIAQLQRLAVDGKFLRGTGREDGKPLALLSIVTHHLRTTLRSVPIEEKSNEPRRRAASAIGCATRRAVGPSERERG